MTRWYAVVSFGAPTPHTIRALGCPRGPRVTRCLEKARQTAGSLRRHVSNVRILECRTRAEARDADISDNLPVVSGGVEVTR